MDNFKPNRGGFRNRANAANAAQQKRALTSLYQSSELSEEGEKKQPAEDELINNAAPVAEEPQEPIKNDEFGDIDLDADIENYVQNAPDQSEEEVPLKKSEKKKLKKQKVQEAKKAINGPRIALVTILILVLGGLGVGSYFMFRPNLSEAPVDNTADSKPDEVKADEIYYSALTGREVSEESQVNAATTCVMIENSLDARPQSGLDQAGVVYEAWAEGGITRFMAVFQDTKPSYIGPVRSVRLTFAHIAKAYHCSIAHVGGASNALSLIRGSNEYRDIDQFFNGDYYWRISSRAAPHNVYTSFEKLDELNFKKGYNSSEYTGFTRTPADTTPTISGEPATTVNIIMVNGNGNFNPVYTYDAENNRYLRAYAHGGPHKSRDENGNEVQNAPTVVIAAKVSATARPGGKGYSDYVTTGENDAYIFQNGTVTPGKWKRENLDKELKFYDNDGNEIQLNRGQVWISLYPENIGSVNWQ